jgi:GNAT superfamily N-acetyltransferase/predicted transcriptional regulator
LTLTFIRPNPGEDSFREVLKLARHARRTVGFLTDTAFAQRAEKGTMLALRIEEESVGYVLYDLPRDEIRIVQLVVAPEHRGRGFARALVDHAAKSHPNRRGVSLDCRNDFPADGLWEELDFVPVHERPGRNIEGKPLTRWFRSLGHPDLFTVLDEVDARPVAVMDACVFFDVIASNPTQSAEQLRADWLVEHARLSVSDHVFVEIHRGGDSDERKRQARAAQPLRLSATAQDGWRSILATLLPADKGLAERDRNDLTYLAQAAAAQAGWLISDDRRFVRNYAQAASALGVRLRLPAAFLLEVDEQASGERYRPVDLAGTAVTSRRVDGPALSALGDTFVNHSDGERIRSFRKRVEEAVADRSGTHLHVVEVDGMPHGLLCWRLAPDALQVPILRVRPGRGESTIGRHLLAMLREQALDAAVERIEVSDPHVSAGAQRGFRDEGFASSGAEGVLATVLAGEGSIQLLRERARTSGSPLADSELLSDSSERFAACAAAAERWFAPFRVLGAGIPTFVVPIQHGPATALLDAGLAEDQLFPREWSLGLRRELVYYRSPRRVAGLIPPARLLWYVSGSAPGAGTIRAVSHLISVDVDKHQRLFSRFRALGVYSADDVARIADASGRVMALRFSHTERFAQPITLDDYRRVVTGDPKSRSVVLRSAHPIDEHTFVRLLKLGDTRG